MILKTKDFQEAVNKIRLATDANDKNAANVEIVVKPTALYLNVTNKEYYVSVKFPVDTEEEFRAVVDGNLFLSLISGLTTEDFTLGIDGTNLIISTGKSNYKVAMIYENTQLMELPIIAVKNKTVEMNISKDILDSIININSKEIQKAKNLENVNELMKLYYIDETGCFTFTNSACLNSFTLEKPVKLLLNDRIIKLFALFNSDVHFSLGQDPAPNGNIRTKITLETANVYLSAIITNDDVLISKVQGPCMATKRYVNDTYIYRVVLSTSALSAAITRLLAYTKYNKGGEKPNMVSIPVTVVVNADEFTITDKFGNTESVDVENGSIIDTDYVFKVNLADIKAVVDSCKIDHITVNCGNHKSVILVRGAVSNLIPEGQN